MSSTESSSNFIVTGGAGFVGSNLTLALQERFPDARITVVDDFRSGNFKNLTGYRGDFVAQNLATLDWHEQFGDGTILTMEGSGADAKLTVYFDRIGSKKFIAKYAKLIRI